MPDPERDVPFVPDVRDRNRSKPQDIKDVEEDSLKEEVDALKTEAPFVPMLSKRRRKRIKEAREKRTD